MLPTITILSLMAMLAVVSRSLLSALVASAEKLGVMDRPGGRHLHPHPVPVVGGLAVIGTWLLGLLVLSALSPSWAESNAAALVVISAGALGLLVLGFVDDRRGLSPRFRLLAEFAVALLTICYEPGTHRFCQELAGPLGTASYALTAIGIVAVINAMNLIDGLDGLAASIFASTALAICALTALGQESFSAMATLLLVPGLVMFLRRNWNPAQVFLGDQGSLPVGFILVVCALRVRVGSGGLHTPWDLVPLTLLFGYPVLDMILCIFRRYRARQPLFTGDRGHLHHRMLRLGLSVRESASSLVGWQLAMLAPVTLIPWLPGYMAWLALLPALLVASDRIFTLGRVEASRLRSTQKSAPRLVSRPRDVHAAAESPVWPDLPRPSANSRESPSKFVN